jgi:elongation factor Ts
VKGHNPLKDQKERINTMAEITASMVKELRELTGAGMMDCKKALNETNGNMEEAVEFLRKNGQAKAEKKASRIAAEGLCRIATKGDTVAAVVEVNSETDFVAKNEVFQTYVEAVANQAVNSESADIDAFMAEKWLEDETKTVAEVLVEKVAVIGEKLSIRRFEKVTAAEGCVVSYVHGGGRIGVLVEAKTNVVNDAVKEALTNLAMQVAALNPKYVATSDVSEEFKEHEKSIIAAQIEQDPKMAGKPEKVIQGAILGRLNKELKEVCLLEQVYVKAEDGKQTVAQYVAQVAKETGADLSIKKFVRFETGEGLEKKSENFAEEVAAQMANA